MIRSDLATDVVIDVLALGIEHLPEILEFRYLRELAEGLGGPRLVRIGHRHQGFGSAALDVRVALPSRADGREVRGGQVIRQCRQSRMRRHLRHHRHER